VQGIEPVAIGDMMRWCALNAVRAQEVFDAAAAQSAGVFPPPRMRIGVFEFAIDLDTRIERTLGFEIRVVPLNLGYRIARKHTAEAHTRLTVTVAQTAAPPA